ITVPPPWTSDVRRATASILFPEMGKDSSVSVECVWAPEEDLIVDILASNVSPSKTPEALGVAKFLPGCEGNISGKVKVRRSIGNTHIGVDLRATELSYGDFRAPGGEPVTIQCDIDSDPKFHAMAIPNMELGLGGAGRVKISAGTVSFAPYDFGARVSANIDLEKLGTVLNLSGIRGVAELNAPAKYSAGALRLPLSGTISDLTVSGAVSPLDQPVSLKGILSIDTAKNECSASELEIRAGAGSVLTITGASLAMDSGKAQIPLSLQSDMAILTRMGWLADIAGQLKVTGTVSRLDGAYSGSGDFDAQAESLTLPNSLVGLGGVSFKGTLNGDAGLGGSGKLRAANISVAGAALHDVTGTVELGKDGVNIADLAASVFGGTVKSELSAGLLSGALPVNVNGAFEAIDLDVFTKEFKPPGAILTGVVQGEFSLAMDRESLKDFRVTLGSVNGITMNRNLVEQLLVSGAVKGFTGAKTLERVMSQIVGDAEQRAFDRATLTLSYQDGQLKGQAGLHSKELNLTIDLTVDPAALKDAIEIRQQTQLENVAGIRADPVQL
ncbi:MAG: hypothetical protein HZB26_23775, partial [Candidatus Hydrogenedentes bacterium]|nr:hypothetical protein [Candidatus Hydrogenedentota bacterium]